MSPWKPHSNRPQVNSLGFHTFVYSKDRVTSPDRSHAKAPTSVGLISEFPSPLVHERTNLPNRGDEASAYLTHIIEHYDRLPTFTAFHHAHYASRHNNPLALKLECLCLDPANTSFIDLSDRDPSRFGPFRRLRCLGRRPTLRSSWARKNRVSLYEDLAKIWPVLVEAGGGTLLGREVPDRLITNTHGMFLVHRSRIRRFPLSFYRNLHAILMGEKENKVAEGLGFIEEGEGEGLPRQLRTMQRRRLRGEAQPRDRLRDSEAFRLKIALEYLWRIFFLDPAHDPANRPGVAAEIC